MLKSKLLYVCCLHYYCIWMYVSTVLIINYSKISEMRLSGFTLISVFTHSCFLLLFAASAASHLAVAYWLRLSACHKSTVGFSMFLVMVRGNEHGKKIFIKYDKNRPIQVQWELVSASFLNSVKCSWWWMFLRYSGTSAVETWFARIWKNPKALLLLISYAF